MSKKFFVVLALILCFLTFSESKAQSVVKNGRIPEDLVIKYWKGSGIGWVEYTIKADGSVFYNSYSNLPSNPNTAGFLELQNKKNKTKKNELKNKLSKKQLKILISEFEQANFFGFPNRELNNQDGCPNGNISSDAVSISIFIQINGKTAHISSLAACKAIANTTAERFDNLGRKISEILKTVKAIKAV